MNGDETSPQVKRPKLDTAESDINPDTTSVEGGLSNGRITNGLHDHFNEVTAGSGQSSVDVPSADTGLTNNQQHARPTTENEALPGHSRDDPSHGKVTENQGDQPANNDSDDDDNLSVFSGMSEVSGKNWKPDTSGRTAWIMRAMARGTDPRGVLAGIFDTSSIPEGVDDMSLWRILHNIMAEPPRRKKLPDFNTLEQVVDKIKECKNILVLTGAGVSVSCGIPDFRSKDGVYARLAVDFPDLPDPQAMFDIHYFRKDPRPFFKFAREIYPGQFEPSPCHKFIQCVESTGKLLRNYTQNIDTLEQVAGIAKVIQCHGSFATASCTVCKYKVDAEAIRADIFSQNIPICPRCPQPDMEKLLSSLSQSKEKVQSEIQTPSAESTSNNPEDASGPSSSSAITQSNEADSANTQGLPEDPFSLSMSPFHNVPVMKPDIVFFGEGLPESFHSAITADKDKVDLLIVIGSSLKVRPVALIPSSIPFNVPQILINREPLPHLTFDVELLGDCDVIVNQICHMLGDEWKAPIHKEPLLQTTQVPQTNSLNTSVTMDDSFELDRSSEVRDLVADNGEAEGGQPDDDASHSLANVEADKEDGDSAPTDESKSAEGEKAKESNPSEDKPEAGTDEGGAKEAAQPAEDDDNEDDEEDDEEDDWHRPSIAESLPSNQFLYMPPSRYVFPGAEVYHEDILSEDEDEEEEEEEDLDEEDSQLVSQPESAGDGVTTEVGEGEGAAAPTNAANASGDGPSNDL